MESKRQAARTRRDEEDADVSDQNLVGETDREQELAATRIQSRVRGKQARRRLPPVPLASSGTDCRAKVPCMLLYLRTSLAQSLSHLPTCNCCLFGCSMFIDESS